MGNSPSTGAGASGSGASSDSATGGGAKGVSDAGTFACAAGPGFSVEGRHMVVEARSSVRFDWCAPAGSRVRTPATRARRNV